MAFNDLNGHKFTCIMWELQDQISQAACYIKVSRLPPASLSINVHWVYPSYKHASALGSYGLVGPDLQVGYDDEHLSTQPPQHGLET
jgi:hypothetical protein